MQQGARARLCWAQDMEYLRQRWLLPRLEVSRCTVTLRRPLVRCLIDRTTESSERTPKPPLQSSKADPSPYPDPDPYSFPIRLMPGSFRPGLQRAGSIRSSLCGDGGEGDWEAARMEGKDTAGRKLLFPRGRRSCGSVERQRSGGETVLYTANPPQILSPWRRPLEGLNDFPQDESSPEVTGGWIRQTNSRYSPARGANAMPIAVVMAKQKAVDIER